MNAVLKRMNPELAECQLVEYPHLSINKNEFTVLVNDEKVDMPLKEILLLFYLASHPNQVFTRQQLLNEIWGFDFDGDPRTVDVHIMRIREKIKESSSWLLKTLETALDLSLDKQNESLYFYDQHGRLLYKVGDSLNDALIPKNMVKQILSGKSMNQTIRMKRNAKAFITGYPLKNDYREKGLIIVSFNPDHDFKQAKMIFLLALIPTILMIAFIIFVVSKKITTPLKNMSMVARNIAEGDFTYRVKVNAKDEIGKLGETFNFMAEELESMEKMRRDFLANVSHDLRTPLTSLHGFLTAFSDGTIPKHKEKVYLKMMKDQTEKQIKLVNDLLDHARMEANQLKINQDYFNLSEEIRKIIARHDPELTRKNVDIGLVTKACHDLIVYADLDRIDQVVSNLLENAIQFSPEKSSIDVILSLEDDHAKVSIQDYGQGIKKENLKFIWQRFYKEDGARTNKVGTGIGLSIVKQILGLHHSTITVESEEGKGTVFTFNLPIYYKKS